MSRQEGRQVFGDTDRADAMQFTVTGEWDHNRLLQVVVVLYCFFVVLLWLTNWMLYFDEMDFTTASVVKHYLGDEVFRHFSFDVPNPMFPTELARSVKERRKLAE